MKKNKKNTKNAKPRFRTVNLKKFTGTWSKLKRLQFILYLCQGCDVASSLRKAKLSHHGPDRLVNLVAETGGIEDRPRSGRPVIYTEAVMKKAYGILADHDVTKYMGVSLLKELKEQSHIHPKATVKYLLRHLEAYVWGQVHTFSTNCTRTTFGLTNSDHKPRLDHAKNMLTVFKNTPLLFAEEMTLEDAPYPKGEDHTS